VDIDELRQAIRRKNLAYEELYLACVHCRKWQYEHMTADGLPDLPAAWEARRAELARRYQDALEVHQAVHQAARDELREYAADLPANATHTLET